MEIKVFTKDMQGHDFYGYLGPYFADRSIMEEMTLPLYNEPGGTWFVGFDGEKIAGFCCLFENKRSAKNLKGDGYIYFDNFYIPPEYRGNGYSKELFEYRQKHTEQNYKGWIIEAMSRDPRQIKNYEKSGFIVTGKRGSYKLFRKEIQNE